MSAIADSPQRVEDLVHAYLAAADELDADRVSEVLAHAQVDFAGRRANGAAEVRTIFAEAFCGAARVRHLLSNVRIRVQHDGHRPTADFSATYVRWGLRAAEGPLGLGDYTARLELAGGDWRFTRFAVRRLWSRDPGAPVTAREPVTTASHPNGSTS